MELGELALLVRHTGLTKATQGAGVSFTPSVLHTGLLPQVGSGTVEGATVNIRREKEHAREGGCP